MEAILSTPFERALDAVDQLPLADQEAVMEIVRQRQIARRRDEIAALARNTLQAFREGGASYGTIDDLRRDLLADE